MLYTICFMVTGGITVEAASEEEAIREFESGGYAESIGEALAMNEITMTEIFEEDE